MDPSPQTSTPESAAADAAAQTAASLEPGSSDATGNDGADGPDVTGPPAEGSDAWVSQEFGRNLTRLREAQGITQSILAAKADVPVDSIRGYESGANRPRQPFLWQLAQALNVMPISIGPGMTRKGLAPVPTEIQLTQKNNRGLRLQRLVELLGQGQVSEFAVLTGLPAADLYALASSEVQPTEAQLTPLLELLPQVRRTWLLNGDGEPLQPARTATPEPTAAASNPALPAAEVAAPPVGPRPQPVPPVATNGPVQYVPLSGGLVAEVATVEGVITQVRFLAGAGTIPGLTVPEQLDGLCEALRRLLPCYLSAS